ncbi:MAB_1171c family putative transporter [Streptomyces sp. G5(2025)]|uniref:MAB_1171c family putative transporter n=1 Tax=Streptomyces sp. G5(2025) TaxID=3406628 RepID=UPI003C1C2B08
MAALLNAIVLGLLWATVVLRVPSLARGASERALWLIFLTLALAKTAALSTVRDGINSLAGGYDIAPLLYHLLGVAGATALLRFISLVTGLYAVKARALTLQAGGAVAVALLLMFLYALDPGEIYASADEFLAAGTDSPAAVVYWLILETYLGAALMTTAVLFWRVSRSSTAPLLRIGFRTVWLGLVLNALYAIYKIVYVVAHLFSAELPKGIIAQVSDALLAIAVGLMVIGVTLPALSGARKGLSLYRSLHSLNPLWRTVGREFPEIVLPVPHGMTSGAGGLGAAELRRYRRIIEIRDGMVHLRSRLPATVGDEALAFLRQKEVAEEQLAVLAEACWIEAGLRSGGTGAPSVCEQEWPVPGGKSIEDEAVWLSRVSHAWRRSPVPREFAEYWVNRETDMVDSPG